MTTNKTDDKSVKTIEKKQIDYNKIIIKRIKTDCVNLKLDKINEIVINSCHTQALCIDACARAYMTVNDTVNKLVELKLCTDTSNALKRIKRHYKHDDKSRVIKRNMLLITA
jgi:hypothetical protein